jgi:NitT/TauT family transport system permease protein
VRSASGTLIVRFASVIALFLLWEIAARLVGSRQLPPASAIFAAIVSEIVHGGLLHHLAMTLFRVVLSFILAMSLGTAIGFAMGRWRALDVVFDSWIVLLLNLPALVVIVLAYVWFGLTEAAAIGAVALNKLPLVVVTLREGARSLDPDFADMARSFRVGAWRRVRHIIVPQLSPFLVVAARSGLSLIWKIVLVVELLGRSDGVGFQIQLYFQLFDVTRILAYTIAFVAVVQAIEWTLLQPIERRVGRWRR